jgi:hypothetical protein
MNSRLLIVSLVAGVLAASACGDGDGGGTHEVTPGGGGGDAGAESEAGAAALAGAAGRPEGGAGGSSGGGGSASLGGDASGDSGGAGAATGGVVGDAGAAGSSPSGGGGGGSCEAVEQEQELAAGIHVEACSDVTYATNPPSSGSHYPIWADYGVYDFALPRGYWVHNLEHGSVVVTYNCQGCGAEVAAAKAWLAGLEPDATCASGPPRVLLLPDPKLDVRWAASSWGFTLRSDCFDAEAFSDFYVQHAGKAPAPEAAICTTGTDFRTSGACGVE